MKSKEPLGSTHKPCEWKQMKIEVSESQIQLADEFPK